MTRVLMTADTVGGVWTYALELVRALAARGIETVLATMGNLLSRDQRAEAYRVPGLEVYESCFRLEWMRDPWAEVARAGDWLLSLEEQTAPDVVHLNSYSHAALPFRAPVMVVGHSCVLSWWQAIHACDAPAEWNRYRREVSRGLRSAGLVAAPTRFMLNGLEACYGTLRRSLAIPNGRTASLFSAAAGKEPFVFSAGRLWDAAKNLACLARAAEALEWPVVVAGQQAEPGNESPAGAAASVRLLGAIPPREIAAWLSRAAVYALPARYEPFGLSVLEAALAGCELVLGDIPSLREVWGDTAFFVPPDDPEALGAAIRAVFSGHRKHPRARALTFTPDRMAGNYLSAYGLLLQQAGVAGQAVTTSCQPLSAA